MNNIKKLLSLMLAVAMVMSMAACNPDTPDTSSGSNGPAVDGQTVDYTVTVKTQGNMGMAGVGVEIYEDDTMTNLVNVAQTDENGKATLKLAASDSYAIKVSGAPKGYTVADSYKFSGSTALITLKSALIEGESMSGATFELGDVMYDFEITQPDGTKHKLSDVLAEKKMVMLNIFFTTCSPCNAEMPYMVQAYEQYQDEVGIFALCPYGSDNDVTVQGFADSHGLPFPYAKVPNGWSSLAVDGAYPTTYVIDRYGVVCLVEVGGLTSLRPFTSMMEYFTRDDYEQKLVSNLDEIISRVSPTVEDMEPEQIVTVLGDAEGNVVYSNETEDEYCWPFVSTEKDGQTVLKATNSAVESSYSILYMDVTLKKGQAIGFDYLISSEAGNDVFHVIVDETPIFNMSGVDEVPTWKACYPWVAQKDGTYRIGLAYIKDDSDDLGDDTAYIKNVRIINSENIDVQTFLPQEAAVTEDGFEFEYAQVFYNEADGYYHVGSAEGPLLLANLLTVSQYNEEDSLYNMALNGDFIVDGVDLTDDITPYASYASNSKMTNYCTVTKELAELLKKCVSIVSFENNENEWLKLCKYYAAYGTNGAQLEDPISGLATFSAPQVQLGYNEFEYDGTPIMPRGKLHAFTPSQSGVYRITSHDNGTETAFLSGWIFDDSKYHHSKRLTDDEYDDGVEPYYEFEVSERNYTDSVNVSMVVYMEAGRTYYLDIAFWNPYTVGVIPYTIEYIGATADIFTLCSPGPFTYIEGASGNIQKTIHGFTSAVLGDDGYYYFDLGKDENGNQIYGGKIYADFTGTGIINTPIAGDNGLIERGAFVFSQSEDDLMILQIMRQYDNDREKVEEELLAQWGEDLFAENQHLIEDVFNGKFHGEDGDMTEAIRAYLSKMVVGGDADGCVPVDEELAQILQLLMDKFTFEGVDQSWLKLCYYFKHYGQA